MLIKGKLLEYEENSILKNTGGKSRFQGYNFR